MVATLTQLFDEVTRRLGATRARAVAHRDVAAAGQLDADRVRTIRGEAASMIGLLGKVPRTVAAAEHALVVWNYQGLDLAADFGAVETALHAVGDWIAARAGALWNGYAMDATYPWAETVPTFTAADTVGLRTELDALIVAIDTLIGNIAIG